MRNRILSGALGALIMLCTLVGEVRPSAADEQSYRIMPGDRLAVTVFGHETLSGKFLVDLFGAVDLPVIGRVPVSRMTLEEARLSVVSELARGVVKKPSISVKIDEYRPVYIFGHVKTPGAYPFRPSMTAIGVMILAGGEPKYDVAALSAATELITSEERLAVLTTRRNKLLIHLAGLEAQRNGKDSIDLTFLTPQQRLSADIQELIANEKKRFDSELNGFKNEVAALQNQKPHLDGERVSLRAEIAAQKKLLEINRARQSELDKLGQKGLARTTSQVDLSTQQAVIDSSIGRLNTAVSRNELETASIELKTVEKRNTYEAGVMKLLTAARQDMVEADILMVAARHQRDLRRQAAGSGSTGGSHNNAYVIFRPTDTGQLRLDATPTTLVEPGDIVEIRNLSLDDGNKQTASPSRPTELNPSGHLVPMSAPDSPPGAGQKGRRADSRTAQPQVNRVALDKPAKAGLGR